MLQDGRVEVKAEETCSTACRRLGVNAAKVNYCCGIATFEDRPSEHAVRHADTQIGWQADNRTSRQTENGRHREKTGRTRATPCCAEGVDGMKGSEHTDSFSSISQGM